MLIITLTVILSAFIASALIIQTRRTRELRQWAATHTPQVHEDDIDAGREDW